MKNKPFFMFFLLAFIVMQSWFLYINVKHNYQEISILPDNQGNWVITGFESFTAALQDQFKIGDKVLRIDGIEPSEYPSVQKWRKIDQAKTVLISRGGQPVQVVLEGLQNTKIIDTVSSIGEMLSLAFAILLFFKLRNSKSGFCLAALFFTIGCIFASLGPSVRGDALGKLVIFSSIMILPVVFLHFLKFFFAERGNVEITTKSLAIQYVGVGIAVAVQTCYFFNSTAYYVFRFSSYFTLMYFIAGVALIFYYLLSIYLKYRLHPQLTLIIKTIFISIIISFLPFLIFSYIPKLFLKQAIIDSFYTAWFVLFFPISFAYLILSKQLFDIDVVVRRVLYTVIIAIIPSLLLSVVEGLMTSITISRFFLSFFITILVMSFVLYSLEYLTTKLEKIMFPRKYYLQASLKKIAKNLPKVTSFREMKEIILVDIVNTMQVQGGAIVFQFPDYLESIGEGAINLTEVEALLSQNTKSSGSYQIFEINKHEEYTSYFVLTRKKNNSIMNREEIQWLNLIISYLSVSLENVYLIRKLSMKTHELALQLTNGIHWEDLVWLRKTMFELQERERIRISNDLHDTTMQDIFFVIRKLKSMLRISGSPGSEKLLHEVITHLELVNVNLRNCCFELNPYLIQNVGLTGALKKLFENESGIAPFELKFDITADKHIEAADFEIKRHAFRVIQELLTNAKKHSHASSVSIKLLCLDGALKIIYADDGVGIDETSAVKEPRLHGGFGIEQMKARVTYVGGQMEMKSENGKGVRAIVTIPILEATPA